MSRPLHVCVIGAGSSYTPELIEGFINRREELDLRSIRFVDIDWRRLDILASMAERMFRHAGMDVPVLRYEDRRRGIEGADVVVSQLRVGGQAARIQDEKIPLIANTRNRGAIPNLPDDVVVETSCFIGANGAWPVPTAPLQPEIGGLVQAVKAYELLAVEAGTHGDRRAATLAMLAHPLVPDYDAAADMLDVLLEANGAYLPQFFG